MANPNPSPETRFGAENGNPSARGRWNKEGSISYNYNKIMRMSDEELAKFKPTTQAEKIALMRVQQAAKDLGLADAKEISDRTEGKAPQFIGTGDKEDYNDMFERLSIDELRKLATFDADKDS